MTASAAPETSPPTPPSEHGEHEHPPDRVYVYIALILAALTAVEIALYYVEVGAAEIPALLTLMVLKFVIVALFFMHLKFDSKVATRMFLIGLVLALGVYVATLATFAFWI